MKYVLTEEDLQAWKLDVVGGKGYALAEIMRTGVNVPHTICVITNAYRQYIEQPEAQAAVKLALQELSVENDAVRLEQIATRLRQTLLALPIPAPITDQIGDAYRTLTSSFSLASLAVRSSATAEDLAGASFAGQYDSFLFLNGLSSVLEAVRKCWVSLWSARAIAYRNRLGIEHEKVAMAVIIQGMVEAESAGVLFTTNPLTSSATQMLVNAVWGIGEGLVSGEVNADEWVIDKRTGKIIDRTIAEKSEMVVGGVNETRRVSVPEANRRRPVLSSRQLEQLRKVGIKLETHFGRPQDVEWAFLHSKLYILQSRSITTLNLCLGSRLPQAMQNTKGYWTRMGFSEWFQLPLSPLFSTLLLPQMDSQTDSLLEKRLGIKRASPSWKIINGYYYVRGDFALTPSLSLLPFRFIRNIKRNAREWKERTVPRHMHEIEQLSDFAPAGSTAPDIQRHLERLCGVNSEMWAWIILTGLFAKTAETVFDRLYQSLISKDRASFTKLVSGFPNKSIEADEALWQLARRANANDTIRDIILRNSPKKALELLARSDSAHAWLVDFYKWIDSYGHRIFDLDFLHETIQDNPSIVVELIRRYMEFPVESPELRLQRALEARVAAEEAFERRVATKWFLTRWLLQSSLKLAQTYAAIRESRPFYLHLGWPPMRKDIMEVGRRFVAHHMLTSTDDVFFLTADEFKNWTTHLGNVDKSDIEAIEASVVKRKEEWISQKSWTPPENIHPGLLVRLLLRKSLSNSHGDNSSSVWRGIVGSPGKAQGTACIIKSQDDFGKFKKGQILIATYTTPAWTPLLALAAGVVTERGGALSHAAIVAREYGIPAVVGVAGIIGKVSDGTDIEVDGDKGVVRLQ